jgi:hypothetical protein
MRGSRFAALAALAALAVSLACGDGGNGPSRDQFAGTWDATKLEFTNVANTSEKVDVIADLSGTFVIVLESNGTYQATATVPGQPVENTTGTWSVSSDVLTIKETGVSFNLQFNWSLSGNTLTISGADSEFDFTDNGVDDPVQAKVSAVLVKR